MLGAVEWSLPLHRPGLFPATAIGPARAMLVPTTQAGSGCDGGGEGGTGELALRVWVHVAAAQEAWDALEQACVLAGLPGVQYRNAALVSAAALQHAVIMSLVFTPAVFPGRPKLLPLRRIELLGPGSEAALLDTLLPVDKSADSQDGSRGQAVPAGHAVAARIWSSVRLQRGKLGGGARSACFLDILSRPEACVLPPNPAGLGPAQRKQWKWPPGCTLGMEAVDPRLAAPLRAGGLGLGLPGIPLQAEPLSPGQLEEQRRRWPGTGEHLCDLCVSNRVCFVNH